MKKYSVCILFGGVSPEHEVSLRSAESVLNNIDQEKYQVYPVGITREGQWIYFPGKDYSMLPAKTWNTCPGACPAVISPARGQGLMCFEGNGVITHPIDVVFPVLHGENGEDGAMQGLLQMAGIPYVGPHVSASAVAMDKTLTKLVIDKEGIPQAAWELVRARELAAGEKKILDGLEARSKALAAAAKYDDKVLVEEFIRGKEIEVAVLGNENPVASVCGEIDSGAEFYDYDAKYITDTSRAYIPARIPEDLQEEIRKAAVRVFRAIGCQGLSRVDFFATEDGRLVLNEINTLPGFTSISMYPKLFAASGIPYSRLIDELLKLAMEAGK